MKEKFILINVVLFLVCCDICQVMGQDDFDNILYPLSDTRNIDNWKLNKQVSDEFNAEVLDKNKWYVVGEFENGKPFYKHPDKPNKKVWKGRAPSQFSGKNYRLEKGKLILETRWEPNFPFSTEIRKPIFGKAFPYENITTACLIGRRAFKYGYIEIRSKAAKAPVSSAFWATGEGVELDFFELYGATLNDQKRHLDNQLWWSVRDWKKPISGKPSYTEKRDLGFKVADNFHVYGVKWDQNGITYYIDGKLFSEVSSKDVNRWVRKNRREVSLPKDYNGYVADRPINLWIDQEVFPWNDVPRTKEELESFSKEQDKYDGIVDFQIDYIRVWQKEEI